MQLALTPEEAAFRDELRSIYTTKIPRSCATGCARARRK